MNRTVEETANTISKDIYIDDSNGDGLPDWYQALYGAAAATADVDTDGDGITAWNEYLGHTDPTKIDTDGNGEADGLDDSDSDGRTLADEQALGSYANLHDTDDDGVPDGADLAPVNALLPAKTAALLLDGTGYLVPPANAALNATSWTIGLWIKPDPAGKRRCRAGTPGSPEGRRERPDQL